MAGNKNIKNYIQQLKLQWLIIMRTFIYKYNKTKFKNFNNLIKEKKNPPVNKNHGQKNYIKKKKTITE